MLDLLASRRTLHPVAAALLLTFALSGAPAVAAPDEPFQLAYTHFMAADGGSSGEIDAAANAFDALLAAEPANPVLRAYAGAAQAMRARTTWMPWKKMGYAEDGLAQIDKALALLAPVHEFPIQHGTPGSLEVRFIAARTFLAVPGFMNRGARGAKLLADVLASPLFEGAPLSFKGQVWMRAAQLAADEHRTADARHWLEAVVASGAPQAEAAAARLKAAS